jgi:AraC family transcriptional regulator
MSANASAFDGTDSARVGRVRYTPDRRQPLHAHDDAQLTLVLGGSLRERVGTREEQAGPLSVVIKRRGVEHADVFGRRGADTFTIVLPAAPGDLLLDEAGIDEPWKWLHAPAVVRPILRFADRTLRRSADQTPDRLAGDGGCSHPGAGPTLALDAVHMDDAGLLDIIVGAATDLGGRHGEPPGWLQRIRERIDDGCDASNRVGEIADDAGVHPVYLARCFRHWFGCPVSTYIQRSRLRRAAALMENGKTLTRIAHMAGYADQSHFCRQFREATGLTPGAYLRLSTPAGQV